MIGIPKVSAGFHAMEGDVMYLGIADFWVFLAYVLCIGSAVLCVLYGLINWNRNGGEITPEYVTWAKEEDKLSEEL